MDKSIADLSNSNMADIRSFIINEYHKWMKAGYIDIYVSSFKEWVKMELGIEMDYLKLIRIGSNVSSMINMTETERKTFLNKLLEEADIYLKYFKKVNDEVSNKCIQSYIIKYTS